MDQQAEPASDRRHSAAKKDAKRPTLRQRVHVTLEEGQAEGGLSHVVEYFLIVLIITNVVAIILETVPKLYARYHGFFSTFELFTVIVFAIEYALRVWSSPEDPRIGADHPVLGRLRFAMRPMMVIDFLSFAPFFLAALSGGAIDLRALRILRLLRLLKIARYSQAMPALLGVLYAERRALLGSFILLLCTVCAAGEVMHLVEGPGQPREFGTLPDSMYWAITTLATVGYGDEVPITMLGKLVAGVTMVLGLVLFAMPIGIIAKGFVDALHRREFSITWSMVKRQPLFEDFGVEAVGQIVDLMGARVVQDHTRIAVAGQNAETFYLIISGRARAEDETGAWDLEPGDMIGDEALGDEGTYARTVLARTEMRLMVLPSEELRRLSRKFPLLEQRIKNEVAW
ncbi:MAG: cyclic nucleotide-gated ion channel/potassium channel family protein [Pseudomonadota bacterium]|nr:cyclic nucleotide-gated ion channel/potassium channel family protein [Pseudomonadota bacterium]